MSLILTDVQQVVLSVSPVTAKGNPAPLGGVPVWTTSDATLVDLTQSDDGLSATVVAKGPLGSCQVSVSADADVGEGVVEIVGVLDIEIKGSMAVSLNIGSGVPTDVV